MLTDFRLRHLHLLLVAGIALSAPAGGEEPTETIGNEEEEQIEILGRRSHRGTEPGRETTTITRRDLQERLPRSAPDALRYEPGVFVQQTAHGQGSAYIRGRTGQQTVLMFDGIRLSNSTFRQGPNQYFFTIDARTIDSIEVLRGGASTLYGSDAIGGVILARPVEPRMDPKVQGLEVHPGIQGRSSTADDELGGRVQLDLQAGGHLGFFGGAGYREVGELESGGPVRSPVTGQIAEVPRFREDGRTQLGTGFREATGDGRIVVPLPGDRRLVLAAYGYWQFDAPRTDQCPPPFAARDECMRITEQFRTLTYAAFEGAMPALSTDLRATLSYGIQHERRERDRPSSFIRNGGRDDVHTLGLTGRTTTALPSGRGRVLAGVDLYWDRVESVAWTELTDLAVVRVASRGQYLGGSQYLWGGVFAQPELRIAEALTLRGGTRLTAVWASAPGDAESGTEPVDRGFAALAWNAGLRFEFAPGWSALLNIDRSFRAPNLDDLTSRQQTGPGFQFENPALGPESALTLECGLQLDRDWLEADLWAFVARLHGAIERAPRGIEDCPPETPQCESSWNRFQLINLGEDATILGAEGIVRVFLPGNLDLRATATYTLGDGPNPQARPADPSLPYEARVPLSRIPPMNGTVELIWRHARGFYLGASLRWATMQDRLSLGDRSDARIPQGGTPGFAVLDLRMGFRVGRRLHLGMIVENLTDEAYRTHGSSINGAGRGLIVVLEGTQ